MTRLLVLLTAIFLPFSAHATQVKEVITPKGLHAWLVEEHSLPLVAVKIAFTESGYAHDPAGKEGRANMAAALLMEGAGDMTSQVFNERLESRAIQINTDADEDKLEILMQTLSEHQGKAFAYLGAMLTAPRFDEEAIARVRSQSVAVIAQQEQSPGYMAYRGWQKLAFPGHGYGQPAIGTRESIKALSRSDLKNYASRYITKQNILIAVSGDITPQELSQYLDANIGMLPDSFTPDTQVAESIIPAGGKPMVITHDIPQTMVRFGAQGLKRSDPDYFVAYVMNYIIGGAGLNSKLSSEIREKRGLAYSVATQVDPMTHGAAWMGGFSTRNEKAGEAIETLKATLAKFAKEGPTQAELADAKRFITGSFVLSLDSNAGIVNFLISMQDNKLGMDYFDKRNAMVEAVTLESVKAMAARIINVDTLHMVIVGKPKLAATEP